MAQITGLTRNNTEKYYRSRKLFFNVEESVISNTNNVAQYGTIQNAGDEGGDFVFLKRE